MGCMSSKLGMGRTSSYRYRDTLQLHHATPLQDLFTPAIAKDAAHHLFHTLSAPNTLLPKSQATDSTHGDLGNQETRHTKHTINTWELMAGLDPDPQEDQQLPPQHNILEPKNTLGDLDAIASSKEYGRRSKSCEWSPEDHKLLTIPANSEVFGMGENNGSVGHRCRSFHTVEEYDALLERIWMSQSSLQKPEPNNIPAADSADKNTQGVDQMKAINEDERGTKRKQVGKGLSGSLQMPPTNIEFQTVGSLRQWLLDLQVSSPGGVGGTPKFGYTSGKNQASGEEEEESIEVDPELVSAFEEYMLQLQIEEDNIIKQIEAKSPSSPTTG